MISNQDDVQELIFHKIINKRILANNFIQYRVVWKLNNSFHQTWESKRFLSNIKHHIFQFQRTYNANQTSPVSKSQKHKSASKQRSIKNASSQSPSQMNYKLRSSKGKKKEKETEPMIKINNDLSNPDRYNLNYLIALLDKNSHNEFIFKKRDKEGIKVKYTVKYLEDYVMMNQQIDEGQATYFNSSEEEKLIIRQ